MPLPIPQQVLAQPVTSYYKGKAIRQELATAKKEEELLGLQIEAFKNPQVDPKEARDASLFLRDAVAEAGAAAVLQAREGASPEDVTAAFDGTLVKSGLPEEALAEIKKGYDRNGDGLLGEKELAELEAFSIARGQELSQGVGGNLETLSMEEKLELMPKNRAENSVVQRDEEGKLFVDDSPTGLTEEDAKARGGLTGNDYSKALKDFRDKAVGASVGIGSAIEMVKISLDSPAALGKSGAIVSFANEMKSTAEGLLDVIGAPVVAKKDREKQDKGWRGFQTELDKIDTKSMGLTAIEAAKFKAGVYGIAFAFAVSEQGTRPTDKDIQQFIAQHGGNLTNPEAFRGTIKQFIERQDNLLHSYADIMEISPEDQASAFATWNAKRAEFNAALEGDASSAQRAEDLPGFSELSPEDQAELKALMGQ